jgi:diguanylate cyclase (GGDEF)-like protein
VISIKKYLESNHDMERGLLQVVQLLLQGIGQHAVEGESADCSAFRQDMERAADGIAQANALPDLMMQAGGALKALEEYNHRTTGYFGLRNDELQKMFEMLTATIGSISSTGAENVRRLREIEGQVVGAAQIEDVRQIKARLSECLGEIRKETERQKVETSRTMEQLNQGLENAQQAPGAKPAPAMDPVTGLPGRPQAEQALEKASQAPESAFAAIVVVDRIQHINLRYGRDAGDEVLRYFAGILRRQLPRQDPMFRWTGPSMVVLLRRPGRIEDVRKELATLMHYEFEYTIKTATRSVLLPIAARWSLLPLIAAPRLMIGKIDTFVGQQNSPD